MTERELEEQIGLKEEELRVAEARFEDADENYVSGMMIMLLEMRASLELKLTRYTIPSEDLEEVIYGYADVEAMIMQAGGAPAGFTH